MGLGLGVDVWLGSPPRPPPVHQSPLISPVFLTSFFGIMDFRGDHQFKECQPLRAEGASWLSEGILATRRRLLSKLES